MSAYAIPATVLLGLNCINLLYNIIAGVDDTTYKRCISAVILAVETWAIYLLTRLR